jgi:hypothetical protein
MVSGLQNREIRGHIVALGGGGFSMEPENPLFYDGLTDSFGRLAPLRGNPIDVDWSLCVGGGNTTASDFGIEVLTPAGLLKRIDE